MWGGGALHKRFGGVGAVAALWLHLRPPSLLRGVGTARREDSDPRNINNADMVALRSFSTKVRSGGGQRGVRDDAERAAGSPTCLRSCLQVHTVKTMVTYKQSDDVL